MNHHLFTSGVWRLAPDGVPRGEAPWLAVLLACLLPTSLALSKYAEQRKLPLLTGADVGFGKVAASSNAATHVSSAETRYSALSLVEPRENGNSKSARLAGNTDHFMVIPNDERKSQC